MATKLTVERVLRARPARTGPRLRSPLPALHRIPLALALILVAGAIQSLAWDIALPAFQGPDESAHFAYIQHLAETGSVPSPSVGQGPNSTEVATVQGVLNLHALIGNPSARPAWSSADLGLWHAAERHLTAGSRSDGSGPNGIAKNPPLYYALMAIPYRLLLWLSLLKRLFVLRLINALSYLATIALTWVLAGDIFGRVRWKQALAASVVALEPQLAFMSAVINADSLLITICTAFLLTAVRLVLRGPSTGRVLLSGGLCAAAILTHGRGLVTVPVLGVALLVAWLRQRPAWRTTLIQGGALAAIVGGAVLVEYLIATSAAGGSLYGGNVTALNSGSFNLRQFLSFIYQFYLPPLPDLHPRIGPAYGYRQVFITTFYGTFGSLEVTFSQTVYDALQLLSGVGLFAFYTICVLRWRTLRRAWAPVLVMLAFVIVQMVFLHYVSYRQLLVNGGSDPLIVGRYLLPMVSLFGLAIAFTAGSLPRRVGPLLGAAVIGVGLLLSIGGLGITALRFYG